MTVVDMLFRRRDQRAVDPSAFGPAWSYMTGGETWAGVPVSDQAAMGLLAVYGSVKFIVDGISTLPLDEYRTMPDGSKREISPKTEWLERPTPDLDRVAWTSQVLTSLLLNGNAYLWVQRISDNAANVLPLDPTKVQVRRVNGRKSYLISGVPADSLEIHHIPGLMWPGSDVGLSPVEMARQTIGAGIAQDEYAARFFGQGASPVGVIEAKGPLPGDGPGSPRELARQFSRNHSGKQKAHLPAVLVDAVWKPTGVTNEQAQFLETRRFTAAQVAGLMFSIDPTDLGIAVEAGSSLTYANLEHRNARRVQVTFLPWLIRLERAISSILAGQRYVKYNVAGLLRGDLKTRYESYAIAQTINTAAAAQGQPPLLTTAEMREYEDLSPADVIPAAQPPAPPATTEDDERMSIVVNSPPVTVNAPTTVERDAFRLQVGTVDHSVKTGMDVDEARAAGVFDQPPPVVHVHVPDAPPAEVRVEPQITVQVPDQPPPVVHVEPPRAHKRTRRVLRDDQGRISHVVED